LEPVGEASEANCPNVGESSRPPRIPTHTQVLSVHLISPIARSYGGRSARTSTPPSCSGRALGASAPSSAAKPPAGVGVAYHTHAGVGGQPRPALDLTLRRQLAGGIRRGDD